ncbi:MAG: hypothetical protein V4671_02930 [Armatimonadota bacterium]
MEFNPNDLPFVETMEDSVAFVYFARLNFSQWNVFIKFQDAQSNCCLFASSQAFPKNSPDTIPSKFDNKQKRNQERKESNRKTDPMKFNALLTDLLALGILAMPDQIEFVRTGNHTDFIGVKTHAGESHWYSVQGGYHSQENGDAIIALILSDRFGQAFDKETR